MWTHLFEPHSSYMVHPEFPVSARGVEGLEEKYDYEIAYVDRWVGKLLAALESTGLAGNTAVVVLADHGEAWGEHKHYFHGQDLSEEQLRVPLIVAIPGRKPVQVDRRGGGGGRRAPPCWTWWASPRPPASGDAACCRPSTDSRCRRARCSANCCPPAPGPNTR